MLTIPRLAIEEAHFFKQVKLDIDGILNVLQLPIASQAGPTMNRLRVRSLYQDLIKIDCDIMKFLFAAENEMIVN